MSSSGCCGVRGHEFVPHVHFQVDHSWRVGDVLARQSKNLSDSGSVQRQNDAARLGRRQNWTDLARQLPGVEPESPKLIHRGIFLFEGTLFCAWLNGNQGQPAILGGGPLFQDNPIRNETAACLGNICNVLAELATQRTAGCH